MKLALARYDGRRAAGIVDTELDTWRLVYGADDLGPTGLAELIGLSVVEGSSVVLPLGNVELLAPIPRPARNLICVGKNYVEHAKEFDRSGYDATSNPASSQPTAPVFFTKAPSTVIGSGAKIPAHESLTKELDYEAEVAVVLSKGGKNIDAAHALDHVGYYTVANDVTARDLQRKHAQWFLGKSLDGSCPLGPWLVSADELDPNEMLVTCHVNDELRQQAKFSELIFDVPTLISTLSAAITLEAGDVILTGTPAGVGIGFEPPRFLVPGDTVRIEVSGVGEIINTVEA